VCTCVWIYTSNTYIHIEPYITHMQCVHIHMYAQTNIHVYDIYTHAYKNIINIRSYIAFMCNTYKYSCSRKHIYMYLIFIYMHMNTFNHIEPFDIEPCMNFIQGGEDVSVVLSWRSFCAKKPHIIAPLWGKWPLKRGILWVFATLYVWHGLLCRYVYTCNVSHCTHAYVHAHGYTQTYMYVYNIYWHETYIHICV